jgi:hypothetical protein
MKTKTKKLAPRKMRNPLVMLSKQRKAGFHDDPSDVSHRTRRRKEKIKLKKELE